MNDTTNGFRPELHDILAAGSLLSRLPLPVDHARAGERAAMAVWAYPLVGAVLGLIAGIVAKFLWLIGLSDALLALGTLAVLLLLTGALHEDGIADTADGLGGGQTAKRRLEIMKDSHLGAFGAAALFLALAGRWAGVEAALPLGPIWVLMAVGALSRAPMAVAMWAVPFARDGGLAAGVGRPPQAAAIIAAALGLLIGLLTLGFWAVPALILAALASGALYYVAVKRIGGVTGDILGASQQVAEVAVLVVCVLAV